MQVASYCEDVGVEARVALMPSTRDSQHPSVFPQVTDRRMTFFVCDDGLGRKVRQLAVLLDHLLDL